MDQNFIHNGMETSKSAKKVYNNGNGLLRISPVSIVRYEKQFLKGFSFQSSDNQYIFDSFEISFAHWISFFKNIVLSYIVICYYREISQINTKINHLWTFILVKLEKKT